MLSKVSTSFSVLAFLLPLLVFGSIAFISTCSAQVAAVQAPKVDKTIMNLTAEQGTDIELPCIVSFYNGIPPRVAWLGPREIPLTMDYLTVVSDSNKYGVRVENISKGVMNWNLVIKNVHVSDHGRYACHLSNKQPTVKIVLLLVLVPPSIIRGTPSPQHAREFSTVELFCNATGYPLPRISWYRLFTTSMEPKPREKIGTYGELLIIHNISRLCDDTYQCTASNGVGNDVDRQIRVYVEYPPEVKIKSGPKLGQSPGKTTRLDCDITANPMAKTSWWKGNKEIPGDNQKTRVTTEQFSYTKVTLGLEIYHVRETDYGNYTCIGENQYGSNAESIILYNPRYGTNDGPASASTVIPWRNRSASSPTINPYPSGTEDDRKPNEVTRYEPKPDSRKTPGVAVKEQKTANSATISCVTTTLPCLTTAAAVLLTTPSLSPLLNCWQLLSRLFSCLFLFQASR